MLEGALGFTGSEKELPRGFSVPTTNATVISWLEIEDNVFRISFCSRSSSHWAVNVDGTETTKWLPSRRNAWVLRSQVSKVGRGICS